MVVLFYFAATATASLFLLGVALALTCFVLFIMICFVKNVNGIVKLPLTDLHCIKFKFGPFHLI